MGLDKLTGALRLAAAAALLMVAQAGSGAAQERSGPADAEPVALDATAPVQDVTPAIERYPVDLGAGTGEVRAAGAPVRRGDGPWFGLKLANPTSLPMERLLVVSRPLLAGAGWSAGTASALPQGAAVEWVGAGAPEALPALPGAGGASVFHFTVPPGGTARLAIPGAEGPVAAAVMTRGAYADSTSFRFIILGLGFGLLGVLAALSFARWLGGGDRAAAASAGLGLAAIWVLATQFGHHLPLTGVESPFDPGLKAAGLFLLAGALLFSVAMQTALSGRFFRVLTWSAAGCVILAAAAPFAGPVTLAAGPVLIAATLLALGAAITDAVNHRAHLSTCLPDLASLVILAAVLIAAAVLAASEPSLAADRWAMALHGAMIVSLAVLGGSGLVVHHGVAMPLLADFHQPAPEEMPERAPPALGPEPAAADLAQHDVAAGTPAGPAPQSPQPESAREAMIRELRAAVAGRRIQVAYQPIVALKDGSIAGFEALARWEQEGRGAVPPDEFIPLAEEAGLIDELGRQVLEEAVRRLGVWRKEAADGESLSMNVNISALQLAGPGLVETVRATLEREGVTPEALTLELTESAPADPEEAAKSLQGLKALGVRLALDDFGTGNASLDALRRMPFDGLKIAHSFVQGMTEERGGHIVKAMIALAHELGMTVAAEGVREPQDLERLRALNCDFVQGPFCGPPLAAASAGDVLRRGAVAKERSKPAPFSTGSV
jgi:EAL domain-containing protein (putative c-di-GMP-specific phosphodiesterase class I)